MIYDYFIHHTGKSSGSHDKDESGHRHMFLTFVNNNNISLICTFIMCSTTPWAFTEQAAC